MELAGKTPVLVEHGIFEDESDWRAHVAFARGGYVYFFPTAAGLEAAKNHQGVVKEATQPGANGQTTAVGVAVPWQLIEGISEHRIPIPILADHWVEESQSVSERGKAAQQVIVRMSGRAPAGPPAHGHLRSG
jgi:hypothetical protein